jgi:hypothetical protein
MKLPNFRGPSTRRSRGQAMVEFAIILPLLVLLLVMCIDFGRVFFGWIALQNATRIAADTAAQRANAWPSADGNLEIEWREDYERYITEDLQNANCTYPTPHPEPVFTNANPGAPGDTGDHDFGDLVTVSLHCEFSLITPLAENLFGGPIQLTAHSTFAINGLVVVGVPDAPPPAPPACQAPQAEFDTEPARSGGGRVNGGTSPFLVSFSSTTPDSPDCPNTYLWERRTGTGPWSTVGNGADLEDESFTDTPGGGATNYEIRLTVTNTLGTDSESVIVRVTA